MPEPQPQGEEDEKQEPQRAAGRFPTVFAAIAAGLPPTLRPAFDDLRVVIESPRRANPAGARAASKLWIKQQGLARVAGSTGTHHHVHPAWGLEAGGAAALRMHTWCRKKSQTTGDQLLDIDGRLSSTGVVTAMVHAQAVGPDAAATIPCTDLTFTAYTKGGSGYEDEEPLKEQRKSNVRNAIPIFNGLRELGVGLVVLEGQVEAEKVWNLVGAQCVDVTKPVAAFVAAASGEQFVRPFSKLPAAFVYVPTPGNMVLVVPSQSCGSAVMAPHVLQSENLAAHNAWTLHCGANLLGSLLRPEKPLVPIAKSAFGDLLGSNAATALMQKAKELGAR